ncbi:hypothetical protein [Geodermatophilus normandii]|uniref:hypothetical protein n=1 Tax=Geodermatophilus normandii TaxID=1137989 RepID=UPI0011B80646|nr:hypothetical protein [Geodermatophilus normandii]
MSDSIWRPDPVSEQLIGDSGPWTWALPTLVQAVNDPRGPWSPPTAPWKSGTRSDGVPIDPIAFWAPLTTLTWGMLGWVRPDLGVQRWIAAGRPTDTPQLSVLDRWWGDDALALVSWAQTSHSLDKYSRLIHERTGTGAVATPVVTAVRARPEWRSMLDGGDALHLGHVLEHLLGIEAADGGHPQLGRLVHDLPTGTDRDAHLVLDTYCGWYGTLARLGAGLPSRPDGRSWQVHVTVKPLGYLGTYRRSRKTGRWFAGRHQHHILGCSVF